jgi:hypothetical protein
VERFVSSGAVDNHQSQTDLSKGIEKLRDHARRFFSELAFAHRTNDRLRGEEQVRTTDASLFNTREAAAYVAGPSTSSKRRSRYRSRSARKAMRRMSLPSRTPPRSRSAAARSATICGFSYGQDPT